MLSARLYIYLTVRPTRVNVCTKNASCRGLDEADMKTSALTCGEVTCPSETARMNCSQDKRAQKGKISDALVGKFDPEERWKLGLNCNS